MSAASSFSAGGGGERSYREAKGEETGIAKNGGGPLGGVNLKDKVWYAVAVGRNGQGPDRWGVAEADWGRLFRQKRYQESLGFEFLKLGRKG